MKILIIGGTRFLGRALVESAVARGHEITLFNRGKSNPGLFPAVEQITGDRKTDISLLANRKWDAVIDTPGYEPGVVRISAEFLKDAVEHYIFISSVSVYAELGKRLVDEESAVAQLPAGVSPDDPFQMENYGALKALCEQAAEAALPGRVLIVRPGLIVGPHDPTDRFTYWPWRVAQGGEIIAPSRPDYPTQFIDVRDLADWIIYMVEQHKTGVFNATGPEMPMPMGELLEICRQVSQSDARFVWIPEDFLLQHEVQPWSELPLWLPENDPQEGGIFLASIQKALAEGLRLRLASETVRDTLDWAKTLPPDHKWQAGLASEKEEKVLRAYH